MKSCRHIKPRNKDILYLFETKDFLLSLFPHNSVISFRFAELLLKMNSHIAHIDELWSPDAKMFFFNYQLIILILYENMHKNKLFSWSWWFLRSFLVVGISKKVFAIVVTSRSSYLKNFLNLLSSILVTRFSSNDSENLQLVNFYCKYLW